jgi:HK97 gp10 family phage protein
MDFRIDVSDLLTLAANCDAASALVPDELERAMTSAVTEIRGEAMRLVPVDTGNLRRSLTHEVVAGGQTVTGRVGTNAPYGRYVEEGTRPHFPPVAALAGWARRHGAEPFVVARAISRRGTRARPYLKPALAKNQAAIAKEFAEILPRIVKRLGG